jgi:hypothetical protein
MGVAIEFMVVSIAGTDSSFHLQCERDRMRCHVIRYCKNGLGVHVLSLQGAEERGSGKKKTKGKARLFSERVI